MDRSEEALITMAASARTLRTRDLVVRVLKFVGHGMPTHRIQAKVCTRREDLLNGSVPSEEFIGRTHVYQALCALARLGVVERVAHMQHTTRDPVWWQLADPTGAHPPEEMPAPEVVDLDALLRSWGH